MRKEAKNRKERQNEKYKEREREMEKRKLLIIQKEIIQVKKYYYNNIKGKIYRIKKRGKERERKFRN